VDIAVLWGGGAFYTDLAPKTIRKTWILNTMAEIRLSVSNHGMEELERSTGKITGFKCPGGKVKNDGVQMGSKKSEHQRKKGVKGLCRRKPCRRS